MKTHYKILWIDDDHRPVRGDRRSIRSFLKDHGIELIINPVEVTPDESPTQQTSFTESVSDLDLDMVFIDFNMPEQGNEIIQHIRKDLHHYYLPILFYTSDDNAQQTLQNSILAVNAAEEDTSQIADGIYFCDRDHIAEKAKLILTSLLKKESRPQQTRGLLMDRVSEIDANITECIKKIWVNVPASDQSKVIDALEERLKKGQSDGKDLYDNFTNLNYAEIPEFIEKNKQAIGTFAKAKVLREALRQIKELNTQGDHISDFCNNKNGVKCLNAIRNSYAHDTEEKISKTHDDALCKLVREESQRHIENIMSLLDEST